MQLDEIHILATEFISYNDKRAKEETKKEEPKPVEPAAPAEPKVDVDQI